MYTHTHKENTCYITSELNYIKGSDSFLANQNRRFKSDKKVHKLFIYKNGNKYAFKIVT